MRTRAKCGCPDGEPIIGTFVLCRRCDLGDRQCKCGSRKVEPFVAAHLPPNSWHCWECGSVWWDGVEAG